MRWVVTGGAGFIGSLLAEALTARGDDVLGIDCFTDYYDPRLKEQNAEGLDVRRLDLATDELDFAGFDGV
ncbi:MAG: NAD-dependent epimerase/dehydratase family protein, partial [Gaiellaceae bacterium]